MSDAESGQSPRKRNRGVQSEAARAKERVRQAAWKKAKDAASYVSSLEPLPPGRVRHSPAKTLAERDAQDARNRAAGARWSRRQRRHVATGAPRGRPPAVVAASNQDGEAVVVPRAPKRQSPPVGREVSSAIVTDRIAGYSYAQLGAKYGLPEMRCRALCHTAFAEVSKTAVAEHREVQRQRLEALMAVWWPVAMGDEREDGVVPRRDEQAVATDRLLSLFKREASLLGLDVKEATSGDFSGLTWEIGGGFTPGQQARLTMRVSRTQAEPHEGAEAVEIEDAVVSAVDETEVRDANGHAQ